MIKAGDATNRSVTRLRTGSRGVSGQGGRTRAARVIRLVGGMSLSFGVFDAIFARKLAARVGMERPGIFRAAGAREIATGVGMLAFPLSPVPLFGRLAGDVADIVILSTVASRADNRKRRNAWAGVAIVVAVTAIDLLARRRQRQATA